MTDRGRRRIRRPGCRTSDRPPARRRVGRLAAGRHVRRDGRSGQQHRAHRGRRGERPARTPSCSAAWPACWPGRSRWRWASTPRSRRPTSRSTPRCGWSGGPSASIREAERAELVAMLVDDGDDARRPPTQATEEIHRDETRALNFHLVQELGVDPTREAVAVGRGGLVVRDVRDRRDRPADPVPARLSVAVAGLACGGVGLLIAGGVAARFTASRCGWGRCGSWSSAASRSPRPICVGTL